MPKNNLEELLLENGLSQADLSRESSLSTNTVNKATRHKGITPLTMVKLKDALNRLSKREYTIQEVFPTFKNKRE